MTLNTHTPGDTSEAVARLMEQHVARGPQAMCITCDQPTPCDTIRLLEEREWLQQGYRELQRQVPQTFASVFQANAAAAVARTIILGRLRRAAYKGMP